MTRFAILAMLLVCTGCSHRTTEKVWRSALSGLTKPATKAEQKRREKTLNDFDAVDAKLKRGIANEHKKRLTPRAAE
ncbi:MAG: hypothetical protein K8T91_12985 [Planctomycetes bacterium]|nr:hypothetical protein [Planctomycetota bacterium]